MLGGERSQHEFWWDSMVSLFGSRDKSGTVWAQRDRLSDGTNATRHVDTPHWRQDENLRNIAVGFSDTRPSHRAAASRNTASRPLAQGSRPHSQPERQHSDLRGNEATPISREHSRDFRQRPLLRA